MARIRIDTDKGSLDFGANIDKQFFTTKQIFDLNNFETRNASYTRSITAPATANNIFILGDARGTIDCRVFMDGEPLSITAKILSSTSNTVNNITSYDITIMYGNFSLFDDIKEGDLSDINWADLAIDWEDTDFVTASENTTGLVCPIADWQTRSSYPVVKDSLSVSKILDVNQMGFFIYAKEIISRIVQEAGYTIVIGDSVPADYSKIALACPVERFFRTDSDGQGLTIARNSATTDQSVRGATERAEFATSIIAGLWDAVNWEYEPTATKEYQFSIKGTYSYTKGVGVNDDTKLVLFRNGLIVDTYPIHIQGTAVPFYVTTNATGLNGDVFYVEIQAADGDIGDFFTLEASTEWEMKTLGEFFNKSRELQPSEHIPEIEKSTFLANILKLFNLTLTTSVAGKVVTLEAFDKIYTAEEYDFSEFLDIGKDVISERSIESLGQSNRFEWNEDNLIRRDVNHTLEISNQLLAKSKKVIDMSFSACDNSLLFFDSANDTYLKAKIPMAQVDRQYNTGSAGIFVTITVGGVCTINQTGLDFEVGDYFRIFRLGPPVAYKYYRVIQKTSDTSCKLQTPIDAPEVAAGLLLSSQIQPTAESFEPRLAIIRSDGGEDQYVCHQGSPVNSTVFTSDSLTANWMDSLKWSVIVKNEYKRIIEALDTPDVKKAWFNLPLSVFLSLDLTRPVYVKQFGRRYYMNVVEQYKLDNSVRIELIGIDNFE